MDLSIYSSNYAPEPTGIPFYNTALATWLHRKLGWRVTVHTGMPHYPWWRVPPDYAQRDYRSGRGDEQMDGVFVERVRHFVPTAPVSALARMRLDASWLWHVALRSWSRRRRPHAILVVAPPFLGGLLGLLLRAGLRVPVIYHIQDLQIDAAMHLGLLPGLLGRALRRLEAIILRRVDLVTTISPDMRVRVQAKARTRRRVALFPNWADVEAVAPWPGANRYRQAWQVGEGDQVVMYSGNLGHKQGLEVLLRAALLVRCPMHLVIAGDGVERVELEALARSLGLSKVRFIDLVAIDRLSEFLSAGDVHCIAQKSAAAGLVMPSKLLNIMAVARPVVVTCAKGTDLARVVDHAGCGLTVACESPQALAEGIDALLGDRPAALAMGRSGRTYVERTLGIDAIIGRFARRVERLVDATKASAVGQR